MYRMTVLGTSEAKRKGSITTMEDKEKAQEKLRLGEEKRKRELQELELNDPKSFIEKHYGKGTKNGSDD